MNNKEQNCKGCNHEKEYNETWKFHTCEKADSIPSASEKIEWEEELFKEFTKDWIHGNLYTADKIMFKWWIDKLRTEKQKSYEEGKAYMARSVYEWAGTYSSTYGKERCLEDLQSFVHPMKKNQMYIGMFYESNSTLKNK